MARKGLFKRIQTPAAPTGSDLSRIQDSIDAAVQRLTQDDDLLQTPILSLAVTAAIPIGRSSVVFRGNAGQTLTLPTANSAGASVAQLLVFQNAAAVAVMVQRAGTDTINATTSVSVAARSTVLFVSDGQSKWFALTPGSIPALFTATTSGIVPGSGGGTVNFLRADGTWTAAAGPAGPQGIPGIQGSPGFGQDADEPAEPLLIPGRTGNTGATGPQGPQGPVGFADTPDDPDAPWMVPGPAGVAGTQGGPGASGVSIPASEPDEPEMPWMIPGVQGAQGLAGSQGIQGVAGAAYPGLDPDEPEAPWLVPGPIGLTGAPGAQGNLGAYLPAPEPEEPEAPWLVRGPAGAAGAQGPTGPQGPPGFGDAPDEPESPWMIPGPAASGGGGGITQLTGDVTAGPGSGSQVAAVANIPSGATAAGRIRHTNIAAPATPPAGKVEVYCDSGSVNLTSLNEFGVIAVTTVPLAAVANTVVNGLNSNGNLSTIAVNPACVGVRVFTAGGTYTPTAGTRSQIVQGVAAGGGGGGASFSVASNAAVGGGGANGGYFLRRYAIVAGVGTGTVAVGTAGTAGANTGGTGGTGGNTTFTDGTTLCTANGGLGGVGQTFGTGLALVLGGAAPAVSTNGTVNGAAAHGGYATRLSGTVAASGAGGSGGFGAGGNSRITQGNGNNGTGFGSGGAGACALSASVTGGVGTGGLVLIWEFS